MRIFNRSTVVRFSLKYPDSSGPLRAWYAEVKNAQWVTAADIKSHYPQASLIGGKRVVFNIGGNKYRLISRIDYENQLLFILFLGTHKQYDKIDAETVEWNPKS